jgi:hypothetical protein
MKDFWSVILLVVFLSVCMMFGAVAAYRMGEPIMAAYFAIPALFGATLGVAAVVPTKR